jgi:hypothetical protein
MNLILRFADGSLQGEGADGLGSFVISGGYDESSAECSWLKRYLGAHTVSYRGFAEGKGIWGTWEITADCRGGFHIWPRGAESLEGIFEEAEQPLTEAAPACVSHRPARA